MTSKQMFLGVAAAVGVVLLMRFNKQGAAWTLPGSQQQKMIDAQNAAFDSTYAGAYTDMPGNTWQQMMDAQNAGFWP